ncbi:hypothetical protein FBU30_001182 [Linnemannia zychae]|nr:hypothetical protein FBU30_001182 [Linnemannia zychae]
MSRRSFGPNCVTSDGSTFYAHDILFLTLGSSERTIVLAKSNANPTSFDNVSWTVVATAKETDLGYLSGMNILKTILCHVDSKGVFTIIATTTKSSINDPENLPPGGYQYTPDPNNSGTGTWSKITFKEPYTWSGLSGGDLVTVPGTGGNDVLMHVFSVSSVGNAIGMGVFDPTTKAFEMKSNWTLVSPSNANYLVSTDGKSTTGPIKTGVFQRYYNLYPIGPPEGPAQWAMMTNFSDYAGITLSGPNAGAFQTHSYKMNVTGLPGNGDLGGSGNIGTGDNGNSGSSMSAGMIAGISFGVLLLIISISRTCVFVQKRTKRRLENIQPTTPVDPDSHIPSIEEAKIEYDSTPTFQDLPVLAGAAGVGPGKGPENGYGTSVLPPPVLASRPNVDNKPTVLPGQPQVYQQPQQQQQQHPQSIQSQGQNTYEDGYQQGYQQALLALRKEQEEERMRQEQLRQAQNPQFVPSTIPLSSQPQSTIDANWLANHGMTISQAPSNPQYYAQSTSPQYYPPTFTSLPYQGQQQPSEDPRNPQVYSSETTVLPSSSAGTSLSPFPSYVSGNASMSPSTVYNPSNGSPSAATSATLVWTPASSARTPAVPGSNVYYPPYPPTGAEGSGPSYHQ